MSELDEPRIIEDSDGFRDVWIPYKGEVWRFREIDGLTQERIAEMKLSATRGGYALIAASLRDTDTGEMTFSNIAEGIDYLLRRPLGFINAMGRGAAIANRTLEDPED